MEWIIGIMAVIILFQRIHVVQLKNRLAIYEFMR